MEEFDDHAEEHFNNILALCYSQNQLGVAGYAELENAIYGDSLDVSTEDCESVLLKIKLTFDPTLFLLHPTILSNASLLSFILQGVDGKQNSFSYKTLRSAAWNEKITSSLIYNNLRVRSRSNVRSATESMLETARRVEVDLDIEKPKVKQALGALLTYLQDTTFQLQPEKISVTAIKEISLIPFLRIDSNSYRALQIFSEEYHPNLINKGRSKEGFSLFGLFDRTHSILGKRKLREWMSKPYSDLELILERQKGVRFVMQDSTREMLSQLTFNLKSVFDIPRLLLRIKKVEANVTIWCKLYTSVVNALSIIDRIEAHKRILGTNGEDTSFIDKLFGSCNLFVIRNLVKVMNSVVDFSRSTDERRLFIHAGFDLILDEKRELYHSIDQHLFQAAQTILNTVPVLQKVSVEFISQIGYVICISRDQIPLLTQHHFIENVASMDDAPLVAPVLNYRQQAPEGVNLIWLFNQDDNCYFKNRIALQLDKSFGDVKGDILDRERSILVTLEDQILEFECDLLQLGNSISGLDAYMSFGDIAFHFKLTCPQMTEEPALAIKNGRHLLQELAVDAFVPNDTFISLEKSVAIISGPNGSGKSIYLKQVGLIVYLAHTGSFVPCEKAVIGITDRIFTRILSEETVTDCNSSFSLDLKQTSKILNLHSPRSLCLIDEFGKGTAPVDGMSLLAACIKFIVENDLKAIFALHFTEIFEETAGIFSSAIGNRINCFRMETITEAANANPPADPTATVSEAVDEMKLIPLYKLKYGINKSSYGFACAKNNGIPETLLKRALEIKLSILEKQPLAPFSSPGLVVSASFNLQFSFTEQDKLREIWKSKI